MRITGLGLQPDVDRNAAEFLNPQIAGREVLPDAHTPCSLIVRLTQIGSSWTMLASFVGCVLPTSSPTDARCTVTIPSNGARTRV